MTRTLVTITVNGQQRSAFVEPRLTLADFLRDECGLTGTHVGCEHGVCGACTVLLDGKSVRACLLFAAQLTPDNEVETVEGLSPADGSLSPVQDAFRLEYGLQCGFCTPGFIVTATELLRDNPTPTRDEVIDALGGNLCRCTGYQGIIRAIERASAMLTTGDQAQQ